MEGKGKGEEEEEEEKEDEEAEEDEKYMVKTASRKLPLNIVLPCHPGC